MPSPYTLGAERPPALLPLSCPWRSVQVYVEKGSVDEDLVRSVAIPAAHPAAEEVLYQVGAGEKRVSVLE